MTHPRNPIGASLVALLAALVLVACGDDSEDGERSATDILDALPSGFEYRPVREAEENQVLRQSMPAAAVEQLEDVEMRRVLREDEVVGFAMAIVSGPELGENDVLRGFSNRVGGEPRMIELGERDGRLAAVEGFAMIMDVAGTEMVVVAATDEAGARRLARPILLD